MKQFSIGNTGVTVSALGLGCNNFGLRIDTDASRAVIHKSLDLGTSFRHSADVYGTRGGSENSFGQKTNRCRFPEKQQHPRCHDLGCGPS